MFNFEMPQKKEEDVLHPDERLVENPSELWLAFTAAKDQFTEIQDKSIDELKDEKIIFLPLLKYLKKNKVFVSGNLLNDDDYSEMIEKYDSLVDDLNNVKTAKELKSILRDVENLFSELNLKIL